MASTSFTLPGKLYYVFIAVLVVGTLGCLALLCAAFILVAHLVILTCSAISEAAGALLAVYVGCNSFGRLIIWLVLLWLLFKWLPVVRESALRTISRLRGDISWTK